MRRGWSTLILLVVALALGGYIYFVEWKKPENPDAREKVFPKIEAGSIEEITVKTGADRTTLERSEGKWEITAPSQIDADSSAASAIASAIAGLEVTRVVDPKPADVAQYGLNPPKVEVSFRLEGNETGETLQLGDRTPTTGDVYARRGTDPKVFLVSSFNESTLNKTTFDLRDKAILKVESAKVDKVDVTQGRDTTTLQRQGDAWRLTGAVQGRGDYAAIEGLVTRLSSAQMQKLVSSNASDADLKTYGLDKPAVTVTLHSGANTASLAIGRTEGDSTYARDTSRPLVFTVESSLVTDLKKRGDEYRRKDLFEFRPFNANRLQVTRGAATFTFEKPKASRPNEPSSWRLNGSPADQSKVDDLLTTLTDVRATSFAPATANTGMKSPVLAIDVQYDDNKSERVTFSRSGSDAYAARSDEPGAATLDAQALDGVLKALDEATARPAPSTPPKGAATPPKK